MSSDLKVTVAQGVKNPKLPDFVPVNNPTGQNFDQVVQDFKGHFQAIGNVAIKDKDEAIESAKKIVKSGFLNSIKGNSATATAVVFGLVGPAFCFAGKRFSRYIALVAGLFVGIFLGSGFLIFDDNSWLFYMQFVMPFIGMIAGWFAHEYAVLAALMTALYLSFARVLSWTASGLDFITSNAFTIFAAGHPSAITAVKVVIVILAFLAGVIVNRKFRPLVHAAVSAAIGAWMIGESVSYAPFVGLFKDIPNEATCNGIRYGVTIVFAILGFFVQCFAIKDQEEEDEEKNL